MFKCINKGNFSTHTHTQVRFAEQKIVAESGRSMVEMLGMLAIIGILLMVGIKAFNAGMTQHRANELLHEAQKRAVVVAAQIMAGGDNLSVAEFKNPEGYTFGVEKNPANPNQFNITLTGVKSDVCTKMKTMVDGSSVVRVISEFCDKVTFNNDLSTTGYTTDYDDNVTGCTGRGFTWCAKGDDGIGSKCLEGSNTNCCTNVTYDSQCQSCDPATGEVSNLTTSCLYKGKSSTCYEGVCLDPDITTSTKCLSNDDCGGTGSGYYCRYTQVIINTQFYCTENGMQAVGCEGQEDPNQCEKAGVCKPIGTVTKFNVANLGQVFMGGSGYWWSAKNWCLAQGKHLLDADRIGCFKSGTAQQYGKNFGNIGACCAKGKTCGAWNENPYNALWNDGIISDAKAEDGEFYRLKYSPAMLDLARQLRGKGTYFWTGTQYGTNTCSAFRVYVENGFLNATSRPNSYPALCQ